jgi:hypothetical protein
VPDSHRLDELETALLTLTREVAELRADVRRLTAPSMDREAAAGADPLATPPPPRPHHATGRDAAAASGLGRRIDLESLVGRYGAMALAALTILMAAGTFLGWAIANGRLGPGARVALGGVAAGVVAAIGLRLRARAARRFGNTLLGLALALVHVDAWGAGPFLHVIPPAAALTVAALASASLAALAWRADDESLFVVGTGGALLAPFVTADGPGNTLVLLTYGWVVLTTALFALRGRPWTVAVRLMAAGCLAYTAAAMDASWNAVSGAERNAPATFALGCAWSALLWGGAALRGRLARLALAVALLPLLGYGVFAPRFPDFPALAALGTATAYLALRLGDAGGPRWLADAVLLPLGFLAAALIALPHGTTGTGRALVALAWAGAAAAAAWDARRDEPRRAPHAMVAAIASALAIPLLVERQHVLGVALLAAHAAGVSLLLPRLRTALLTVPAVGVLWLATGWTYEILAARRAYGYTPFVSAPSLAALAAVAGWMVFARLASRAELTDAPGYDADLRAFVGALGALAAFAWGREELASAFSPDVATFLLILYYAGAGVLAIFVGRWRQLAGARRVGLALAIYAALKAVLQASELRSIGLRVGSYLAAGGFLLAVAYWYRAAGDDEMRGTRHEVRGTR